MASKAQPARQIGKQKLLDLVKATDNAKKRMGEERGALGAKYEAAATSDNFNAKALRPLLPLLKMEPGPQAHMWRTILLYADHLGIGAQSDLEDFTGDGADEGGDDEEDEDGDDTGSEAETARRVQDAADLAGEQVTGSTEETGDPVADVLSAMVTPALGRFRTALAECLTPEAVSKGLERFTADNPDDAEAALEMAQERMTAIGQEAGGGEDLRPKAARQAEADAAAGAADAGKADAKAKTRTKRASSRKDAGKIGQEPAGSNLGEEFGGGSRAMH